MHIPDGFLSLPTAAVAWAASGGAVALAARRTGAALSERQVPLMGVSAAFVFAAQMLSFPVVAGTSGHLLGGALVSILLGPWPGMLVMTAVLAVQALLFQDGGLLALGANVLNMAVVGVLVSHVVYNACRRLLGPGWRAMYVGGMASAWLSVVVGALAAGMEIALSGVLPLGVAVPAMTGVHALIGIGEGLITMGALAFLAAARPDLLLQPPAGGSGP